MSNIYNSLGTEINQLPKMKLILGEEQEISTVNRQPFDTHYGIFRHY